MEKGDGSSYSPLKLQTLFLGPSNTFLFEFGGGGDFYGFSENRKCVISLQLALCVVFLRVVRSTLDFRSISVCCIYVKKTLGILGDSFDLQLQNQTVLSFSFYL